MSNFLRKYELCDQLQVSKTTVSHWIKYFQEFIPISKKGDVDVYGLEALRVLRRVKVLREQLYSRPTIKEILAAEGFEKTHHDSDL